MRPVVRSLVCAAGLAAVCVSCSLLTSFDGLAGGGGVSPLPTDSDSGVSPDPEAGVAEASGPPFAPDASVSDTSAGCPPGYTRCGASTECTTNIAGDPANCGACGHDCRGAPCAGSVCRVTVLATGQAAPFTVAVDSTSIYWVNGGTDTMAPADGALMKANLDGTSPTKLAAALGSHGLAINATSVFFSDGSDVMRIDKAGTNPQKILTGVSSIWSLLATTSKVYWAAGARGAAGSIGGMSKDGGARESVATSQGTPRGLFADGKYVFWANQGTKDNNYSNSSVRSLPLPTADGGTPTEVATGRGLLAVAADTTRIYWGGSSSDVLSSPRDGGVRQQTMSTARARWIVQDADFIYVSMPTAIHKVAKDASSDVLLASGQNNAGGLAVDATYLYWATGGTLNTATGDYSIKDGTILRVPK